MSHDSAQLDLNGSTLYISARSPFARRVRLALREHGIRYEERVFDVFKPAPELLEANPLARVPALRFASGEVILESERIVQALFESRPDSPFRPRGAREWLACAQWGGLAVGLCDRSVEYFLETLRPEGARDAEILRDFGLFVAESLKRFEAFIGGASSILPDRLTQADLDMGTALTYINLRYSKDWMATHPDTARYLQRLEERPSFEATRPPA